MLINANINPFFIKYLKKIALVLVVFAISLLIGFFAAKGEVKLLVVLLGAIGGLSLLLLSNKLLLNILVVLSFFVVGQIMYFGGIQQVMLILYGIGLLLYLKVYEAIISPSHENISYSNTPLYLTVLFFIASVFISIIINQTNIVQILVAGKNLFFVWSLFFVTVFGLYSLRTIDSLWKKIHLLVLFQLPIVIFQAFYIVPKRESIGADGVSWDSIVGGFGGDPYGGGASGVLAYFLVVSFIYFLAMYRFKELSKNRFLSYSSVIVLMLFLAEIKVVVFLIPVGLAVVYYKQLFRNPIKLIVSVFAVVLFIYAMLATYEFQKRGDLEKSLDITYLLESSFVYSLDPTYINYETREMGRAAALSHWWQENGTNNMPHTLFGHGPGETRLDSKFFIGKKGAEYPFNINRSSASQILWEVGLLALLLFLWLLLKAMKLSYTASFGKDFSASQKASLLATSASLAMAVVMLPYGRDVIENPILGFYIAFAIGYSGYAYKTYLSRI